MFFLIFGCCINSAQKFSDCPNILRFPDSGVCSPIPRLVRPCICWPGPSKWIQSVGDIVRFYCKGIPGSGTGEEGNDNACLT